MAGKRMHVLAKRGNQYTDHGHRFISVHLKRGFKSAESKGAYDAYGEWLTIRWQGNFGEADWYAPHLTGRASVDTLDILLLKKITDACFFTTQPEELLRAVNAIIVAHDPRDGAPHWILWPENIVPTQAQAVG